MRKIKLGSVEILGFIGAIIWIIVILLRDYHLSNNSTYLFIIGVLPNLGSVWLAIMLGKWGVLFILKKKITVKIHLILCLGLFVLVFISEIMYDLFSNRIFDTNDIIITFVGLIVMFFIPIITKDKYFSDYI